MLYNIRERRINRGPPGKPLSCRSAKTLQCQQISSTQLVPNRAGWHTHAHTPTQTATTQSSGTGLVLVVLLRGWQMEMLCLLKDQAVGYSSVLTYGSQFLVATLAQLSCMCLSESMCVCVCALFFIRRILKINACVCVCTR